MHPVAREPVPAASARRRRARVKSVIARIWHGTTPTAKADDYLAFLRRRAIPDYSATPGNLAVYLLHREEGEITHFLTLTHWASLQAIEAFAGEDITRAKYYAEDANFLLEFEPTVQHYEVADVADVARND